MQTRISGTGKFTTGCTLNSRQTRTAGIDLAALPFDVWNPDDLGTAFPGACSLPSFNLARARVARMRREYQAAQHYISLTAVATAANSAIV